MQQGFKDKVIVITGASGGVGRVTAWEFAKQGARIALIARSEEQLKNTKKEVEEFGGSAITIIADVADAEALEKSAERIEEELGPIDVWINNAMASVFSPIKEMNAAEYKRVTEVTYLGQVYGAMVAFKKMSLRNRGVIIFVGSALTQRGIPLQSAYCGAKHGIQGFYDSFRTELMHDKSRIKTCIVELPAMNTTQFGWVLSRLPNKPRPMGKVYQPEVAARAIVFAAAHHRRGMWVGYTTFVAIIGNWIAPWYADYILAKNGYTGQQTSEPENPNRQNNVWDPVTGDHGAYGDFAEIASSKSTLLWIDMNRRVLIVFCGIICFAAITVGVLKAKNIL